MRQFPREFIWIGVVVLASGLWCYWPVLANAESIWARVADYSHGYLVAPIAGFILFLRRDGLRKVTIAPSPYGFVPLAIGFVLLFFGARYYLEPLQQLSLIIWLIGVVWLLGGGKLLLWALPGILFLAFMFPIPFRYEYKFAVTLQRLGTAGSCWLLQSMGQPAFATGNVINLGDHKLEVAQACSGLRMLMAFLALCSAYAIVADRPIWEKIFIVLLALPIAIVSNILRITITGFLYQYASADLAHRFTHDAAGFAMMPMGLVLLWGALWYIDRLFVEAEVAESAIRVREAK